MGLRFIRQPSETPNVNNADDARMIRYAYGGYDGYVKGKGSELSHGIAGTTFRINSGVVSLQGYESEVDANGWTMTVDSSNQTKLYYSIYYEVNLATQTTSIKATPYSTMTFPDIPASVDLTTNSTGTARLLLYQFTTTRGVIADVNKIVTALPYTNALISAEQTAQTTAINAEQSARIAADNQIRTDLGNGNLKAEYSTTQAQTNNSTRIATTAYVRSALIATQGTISFPGLDGQSRGLENGVGTASKLGNLVLIHIGGLLRSNTTSSNILANIPTGYRPTGTKVGLSTGGHIFNVLSGGQLQLNITGAVNSSNYNTFDITYLV